MIGKAVVTVIVATVMAEETALPIGVVDETVQKIVAELVVMMTAWIEIVTLAETVI